ncbi:unnamed protein product [Moneuplotes crassus]|uniref:Uncharacterized protein n=1 Tax=Euplotes crassus TaxID=5936 RepID=A0AAD1ULW7_EUPCR|nr:unnamed protein product [Moneuplotes crassus]
MVLFRKDINQTLKWSNILLTEENFKNTKSFRQDKRRMNKVIKTEAKEPQRLSQLLSPNSTLRKALRALQNRKREKTTKIFSPSLKCKGLRLWHRKSTLHVYPPNINNFLRKEKTCKSQRSRRSKTNYMGMPFGLKSGESRIMNEDILNVTSPAFSQTYFGGTTSGAIEMPTLNENSSTKYQNIVKTKRSINCGLFETQSTVEKQVEAPENHEKETDILEFMNQLNKPQKLTCLLSPKTPNMNRLTKFKKTFNTNGGLARLMRNHYSKRNCEKSQRNSKSGIGNTSEPDIMESLVHESTKNIIIKEKRIIAFKHRRRRDIRR